MIVDAHNPVAVALRIAIRTGDVAALQHLLKEQPALATVRVMDEIGVLRTPLHLVADWPGHFPNGAESVVLLVRAGAHVNAPLQQTRTDGSPETPLHWAASSDDVQVLDALLDCGADIDVAGAVLTGGTPMSNAVIFAKWNAARRLHARGAQTTLWQAAALGIMSRVALLWAQQDESSRTEATNALWHASRGGSLDAVQFFVEQGAEINWIGYDAKTALDAALNAAEESGVVEVSEWLRANGAKRADELTA